MMPLVNDRAALQRRLLAGIEAAKAHASVDASKVAAVGFCFGGLSVLDIARSGADVRGVVSVHGLFFPNGLEKKKIVAKVMALHGNDDPMVPLEQVTGFMKEMDQAEVDWQLHAYGGTQHAFTTPGANDAEMGTIYSERATRRALRSIDDFLEEVFA